MVIALIIYGMIAAWVAGLAAGTIVDIPGKQRSTAHILGYSFGMGLFWPVVVLLSIRKGK